MLKAQQDVVRTGVPGQAAPLGSWLFTKQRDELFWYCGGIYIRCRDLKMYNYDGKRRTKGDYLLFIGSIHLVEQLLHKAGVGPPPGPQRMPMSTRADSGHSWAHTDATDPRTNSGSTEPGYCFFTKRGWLTCGESCSTPHVCRKPGKTSGY